MPWNAFLYLLLRGVAWGLPWVPTKLAYRIADVAGYVAYWLVSNARHGIEANISRVVGEPVTSRRVRTLAIEAFRTDAKNWIDTLRIRRVTSDTIRETVHVEGWEHLDAALAEGKGAILLSMHLGNFDLVGQILLARGYNLTVPVERMHPRALFDFLIESRTSQGVRLVSLDRAPRELLQTLRAGKIVGVTGDRQIAGKGVRVQFFGAETILPAGPVSLARLSGAPLLLAYGIRLPSNTFRGFIGPPVIFTRDMDEARAMQQIATLMEVPIREHAGQWLAFSPLWDMPTAGSRTTMMDRYNGQAL